MLLFLKEVPLRVTILAFSGTAYHGPSHLGVKWRSSERIKLRVFSSKTADLGFK